MGCTCRHFVFIISVILATTFQIIQGVKHGCWTGDDTTNFPCKNNGYVMCCNGVSGLGCII